MTNVASNGTQRWWWWWRWGGERNVKKNSQALMNNCSHASLFAPSTHWLLAHYSFIIAHSVVAKVDMVPKTILRWCRKSHSRRRRWMNGLFYKFFNYALKWSMVKSEWGGLQ